MKEKEWTPKNIAVMIILLLCNIVPMATCSIALYNDRDNQPLNEPAKLHLENGYVTQELPSNCWVVDHDNSWFTWKLFCRKAVAMGGPGSCAEQVLIKCRPVK